MPDRLTERAELKRLLITNGKSVLMLAPRRIGKTWTMLRFEEDADSHHFDAVLYDAEIAGTAEKFYSQLNRKIEKKLSVKLSLGTSLSTRWKKFSSGDHSHGKIGQALGALPPLELLEAYLEKLNARPNPTIIMIDEIAVFALRFFRNRPDQLENFLSELRALRQGYKNVRWLLTGSIGLDWVARDAEVEGTLNDLIPFHMQPLSDRAARNLIEQLVEEGKTTHKFQLEDGVFEYLGNELGWLSPYYLEALAGELCPSGAVDELGLCAATENDVKTAFKSLLSHHNRGYFSSWREHLTKNFSSPVRDRLHLLLAACARTKEGEEIDTLLTVAAGQDSTITHNEVRASIDILINDGYLRQDDTSGKFCFYSGLLRHHWLRWVCADDTSLQEV